MERSDIGSIGCAAAKCPESEGTVEISVACFYGKISDYSEKHSPATTSTTPSEEEEEEKSTSELSTEPEEFATSTTDLTTQKDYEVLTNIPRIDQPV
ncbi:unnamed protein product [Angiostrongylus costaricensis]|uniref:SCP domain-containing protein n=1 Tax=Angiostrongylus costaricensis TaxID=334426 RepID=A0A158PEB0_ANGCS|nr:unnamed protein product [Angiostrongylus costaricensis]